MYTPGRYILRPVLNAPHQNASRSQKMTRRLSLQLLAVTHHTTHTIYYTMSTTFLAKTEVTHWGSCGPDTSRSILFPANADGQLLRLTEDLSIQEPVMRNGRRIRAPVENPIELSESAKSALDTYTTTYMEMQEVQKRYEVAKAAFKASAGGQELAKILVPEKEKCTVEEVWSDAEVNDIVEFVESKGTKVIITERGVMGHSIGTLDMIILAKELECFATTFVYKEIYSIKSIGCGCVKVYKNGLQYPPFRSEDSKEINSRDPR